MDFYYRFALFEYSITSILQKHVYFAREPVVNHNLMQKIQIPFILHRKRLIGFKLMLCVCVCVCSS